jgi:UDP:flavonoid glycosyltransferase YjiC (YdhE family)
MAFASVYDPPTPPQLPVLRDLAAVHPGIARVLMGIGKWSMRPWVEPVQVLREELGLPRIENPIFEGQHSPTLVLALFSNVLSRIYPDFPPNTVITGFPFYDRDDALEPFSPRLEEFLDDGEPPILFTLGSSLVWLASDFYQIAIEASQQLGRRALLLIGNKRNLSKEPLPNGIAAFDYAPHCRVMPRACCVVHQGGIGTTGQALRSGSPMLIVPHGQDQPDNARRCVELGVGRSLPIARLSTRRMVDELNELLSDTGYRKKAVSIGQRVRSENGTGAACDEIEKVLLA